MPFDVTDMDGLAGEAAGRPSAFLIAASIGSAGAAPHAFAEAGA